MSKTTAVNKQEVSDIHKGAIFTAVAIALLMNTIDATIVATALHTLQTELNTSVSLAAWSMTAYFFGFVLMLPLSAKLSVRYGHRRIFLLSIAIFTIASLLCGLSGNIYMLISMRLLQAIGGSGVTPSATGIIVNYFGKSRDKYLGLFGSFFSIGSMIGPIFGGLFVTYLSWQWIFFINIPLGIIVLLMARRYIPLDSHSQMIAEKSDIPGLVFLASALLSAMLLATRLGPQDALLLAPLHISLAIVSVFSFIAFFKHIKRVDQPFIHPRFIYGKGFAAVNLLNLVHAGMVMGAVALVPLYAISHYGISELNASLLLIAQGVAAVIMSIVISMRLYQIGYRLPLYTGVLILTAGVFTLSIEPAFGTSPLLWLMISTFLMGFGSGVMSPAARNAGIHLAPKHAANIAAIRSLGIQLGQIFTIAIATAVMSAFANDSYILQMSYFVLGVLLLLGLPVISKVPDSMKE